MTTPLEAGYEFEEFVLYPKERLLTHVGAPVEINNRDFDILAHLLANNGRVVTQKEIVESVWGRETRLAEGNISNHVAKIRKIIGCDPVHPRFIRTLRALKGYRFFAPVKHVTSPPSSVLPTGATARREWYALKSHLFVPMYFGANAYTKLGGKVRRSIWAEYKEITIESGRFCLFPSDYGVWHVQLNGQFSRLSDFAIARKTAYTEILSGKHVINACSRELAGGSEYAEPLRRIAARPGYVLSATVLQNTTAKRRETIRHILQILSLPTTLETAGAYGSTNSTTVENKLLMDGMNPRGLVEFGVPGADSGFASWDGVSYS